MCEPEVESAIPFISRRLKIFNLLLLGHGVPLPVSISIAKHVVRLGGEIDNHVSSGNSNKSAIPTMVVGCVIYGDLLAI